jgi:acyl carrier protein
MQSDTTSPYDALRMNTRLAFTLLVTILLCVGCDSQSEQTVERVRSEVAKILQKDSTQIDVAKPLLLQGADELDIVEIVLAVEEAFEVEIPESDIGENVAEVSKTLTVQKLAEIVSKQQKK